MNELPTFVITLFSLIVGFVLGRIKDMENIEESGKRFEANIRNNFKPKPKTGAFRSPTAEDLEKRTKGEDLGEREMVTTLKNIPELNDNGSNTST